MIYDYHKQPVRARASKLDSRSIIIIIDYKFDSHIKKKKLVFEFTRFIFFSDRERESLFIKIKKKEVKNKHKFFFFFIN